MVGEPPRGRRSPRRVLLDRVRPRREPADLLGRPRHPRRRPSQGGLGARRPARRHRPLLPPRLLPAAARRGRSPARAVSPPRHEPAAAHARADGSGRRARRREREARPHPARRLARQGRPRVALPPGHEGRGQPRLGAGGDRHALRRRSREPAPPGARARGRRRSRAPQARPPADGVPHERGTLRLPPGRAPARARRGGRRRSASGARAAAHLHGVHDAHSGAGRQRGLRPGARAAKCRPPGRAVRAVVGGVRRARQDGADRHRLRPDPLCVAYVGVGERRFGASRRGLAGDVARTLAGPAGRSGADHLDHERRARPHLDLRRAGGPARPRLAGLHARVRALRRGSLVGASCGQGAHARLRRANARCRPPRSGHAHDRLRAPLRDVQAGRPALQPAGAADAPARRPGSPGADPPRRKGASRRRGREGRDPARRRVRPRPRRRRPCRLPARITR